MNLSHKTVSFDNYLKFFSQLISVNNLDNKTGEEDTTIFYKIDAGTIVITFSFGHFIIQTKKSLEDLKKEYNTLFDEFEGIKPLFHEWINDKYMDKRGIPEL